jgi:hypothetical protein
MLDNEYPVYVNKEYRCGGCQYIMTVNWDNKTVACINNNCDMQLIDLILRPTMLKVRNNAESSNTSKTANRQRRA